MSIYNRLCSDIVHKGFCFRIRSAEKYGLKLNAFWETPHMVTVFHKAFNSFREQNTLFQVLLNIPLENSFYLGMFDYTKVLL